MAKPTTTTVCFLQDDGRVLLAMKKRGFGAGYWNGYGGKVEEGETVEEAARRELFEESGLAAEPLVHRGVLHFTIREPKPLEIVMHVFLVARYSGVPEETEEMRPQWFPVNALPFDQMWPADRHWLPQMLAGSAVRGAFTMQNAKTLLRHTLHTVV